MDIVNKACVLFRLDSCKTHAMHLYTMLGDFVDQVGNAPLADGYAVPAITAMGTVPLFHSLQKMCDHSDAVPEISRVNSGLFSTHASFFLFRILMVLAIFCRNRVLQTRVRS